MQKLLLNKDQFPSRAHHLQRWFGIDEFLIMMPAGEWTDASDTMALLSAMTIACSNFQR